MAANCIAKSLEITAQVSCLLDPQHAQMIRAVLEKLEDSKSLIVVIPDDLTSRIILGCADFSGPIGSHKMILVHGYDWAKQLDRLFDLRPGLPLPSQFVKLNALGGARFEELKSLAEKSLSNAATRRNHVTSLVRSQAEQPGNRQQSMCILGRSAWNIFDDAACHLLNLGIADNSVSVIDLADPVQTSTLALLTACQNADVLVAADWYRADQPGVIPERIAMITFASKLRVAQFDPTTRNRLIAADCEIARCAIQSGWPAACVQIACEAPLTHQASEYHPKQVILMFDLPDLAPPKAISEVSTRKLVWDRVREEISADPFAARGAPVTYLTKLFGKLNVTAEPEVIDVMLNRLVHPQLAIATAAKLQDRVKNFSIRGRGWDRVEGVAAVWKGAIQTTANFVAATERASVLLDVWPGLASHRARRCGLPLVAVWGSGSASIFEACRSSQHVRTDPAKMLTLQLLQQLAKDVQAR